MIKFSYLRGKNKDYQPSRSLLGKLIRSTLQSNFSIVQLSVSIVSLDDSQALNLLYREKNKPTNVISLEYPDNREQFNMLTGELFLCDEVIVNEATEQSKSIINHYMHMIVHGLLHLQGYDHILDDEAEIMEALEVQILKQFGIEDPYGERKV